MGLVGMSLSVAANEGLSDSSVTVTISRKSMGPAQGTLDAASNESYPRTTSVAGRFRVRVNRNSKGDIWIRNRNH